MQGTRNLRKGGGVSMLGCCADDCMLMDKMIRRFGVLSFDVCGENKQPEENPLGRRPYIPRQRLYKMIATNLHGCSLAPLSEANGEDPRNHPSHVNDNKNFKCRKTTQ